MSARRKPHGQLIQSTPDWFSDRMMGGSFLAAPNAAQLSFVGLYNDGGRGEVLHIWALHAWVQLASTQGNVFLVNGTPGTLQPNLTFPLNPTGAQHSGVIYGGSSASFAGNKIYAISGNNQPYDWYSSYPICALPPTWGLYVASGAVNAGVLVAFLWCALGSDQGFF